MKYYKLLYFVGGVVVGSITTFFITKHVCDKNKEIEIEDIKKSYSNRPLLNVIKREETDMGFKFTATEFNPKETAELNNKLKNDIIENHNIIKKENYNIFSKPPNGRDIHNGIDEDEDLFVEFTKEYEEDVEGMPPKENLAESPYVITPYQFVNEEPYFDKVTLEYFEDDILANAISEEIIEDVDAAIGRDTLTNFEKYATEDDEAVYVRNERRSTDYEILKQHRPFAIFDEDGS